VQRSAFALRIPLLTTVAIVAAAFADPVVESISNTGLAGGTYDDNDHLSIIPTLVLGALLVLLVAGVRCVDLFRRAGSSPRPALFAELARNYSVSATPRDLPLVAGLQFAALYIMESSEQVLRGGSFSVWDSTWLGGPIWFSLGVHVLFGAISLSVLTSLVRTLVRTFAAVLDTALRYRWLAQGRPTDTAVIVRAHEIPLHPEPVRVSQTGGRAPPFLRTTT
jgi:hypothetical protein